MSEIEFVQSMADRGSGPWECRGPLVSLGFVAMQVAQMVDGFHSETAHELFWSGQQPDEQDEMVFRLCVAHWMDLACLLLMRGIELQSAIWRADGRRLLEQACTAARWDVKEIANLLTWQRVQLT